MTDPFFHQPRHDFICKGRTLRTSSSPQLRPNYKKGQQINSRTRTNRESAKEGYELRASSHPQPNPCSKKLNRQTTKHERESITFAMKEHLGQKNCPTQRPSPPQQLLRQPDQIRVLENDWKVSPYNVPLKTFLLPATALQTWPPLSVNRPVNPPSAGLHKAAITGCHCARVGMMTGEIEAEKCIVERQIVDMTRGEEGEKEGKEITHWEE